MHSCYRLKIRLNIFDILLYYQSLLYVYVIFDQCISRSAYASVQSNLRDTLSTGTYTSMISYLQQSTQRTLTADCADAHDVFD